jgi:PncC family amidohydrolase
MATIDEVAAVVSALLVQRGESVAVAESSAGGLISAALLAVPGASAYYKGGVVVYTSDGKQRLAGMTPEQIAGARSATVPHTRLLAAAVRERMGATWGLAETGAAGPTGNRYGDAAGHAALAVSGPGERTQVLETGDNDRRRNMEAFALAALALLRDALDT